MSKILRFSSVLLLLLLVTVLADAQSRKGSNKGTLDKETFMDMESVAGPAISPDGKQIVFTRS